MEIACCGVALGLVPRYHFRPCLAQLLPRLFASLVRLLGFHPCLLAVRICHLELFDSPLPSRCQRRLIGRAARSFFCFVSVCPLLIRVLLCLELDFYIVLGRLVGCQRRLVSVLRSLDCSIECACSLVVALALEVCLIVVGQMVAFFFVVHRRHRLPQRRDSSCQIPARLGGCAGGASQRRNPGNPGRA